MNPPETRFAAVGADRIAYQVEGAGPRDLLFTSGLWGHLDVYQEDPVIARALRRMASWSRLIRFDRRDSGLSDARPADGGSIVDHWIEDCCAVLDAVRSREAVILSCVDSGPLVLKFVERYPERCSGLIFGGTTSSMCRAPDYPQGHPPQIVDAIIQQFTAAWGTEEGAAEIAPALAAQPATIRWYAKYMRAMASPRKLAENMRYISAVDARAMLPKIGVPTLAIGRREQKVFTAAQARYIAEQVPGATYHELPGTTLTLFWEHGEEVLQLVEEFVTGKRGGAAPERPRWRRCCSPTLSNPPSSPPGSATPPGASNWTRTTAACAPRSSATAAASPTRPATAPWRCSPHPRAPSTARTRCTRS